MNRTALLSLAAAFLLGCGGDPAPAPTPEPTPAEVTPAPTPTAAPSDAEPDINKAATVAKAILADPSKTMEALSAAGWTAAEYEAVLYAIAANPQWSTAFEAARAAP